MADDRIQLILDLGASGKNAAEVRQELERLDAAAKSVGQTYEVLAVSGHGYELGEERITLAQKRATQAMEEAAAEANRLAIAEQTLANEAIDKVTRAAIEQTQAQKAMNQLLAESTTRTSTAAVGMAKVGETGKAAGQGVLSASYAIQDFTAVLSNGGGFARALGSIQNNIPQLLFGLGAGAGLTGVVSAAAVAVGILIDNFGKLSAAWSAGLTEAETERLNKLGEAAEKAATAIQKQVDAARNQKSPDQSAIGAAVSAQTGGADFDKVVANAAGDMAAVGRQKAALQRRIEAETEKQKGAAPDITMGFGQNVVTTRDPNRVASERVEKELRDQVAALTDAAKNAVDRAKALVVRARAGDMDAYDELLATTTGDVHDQLAAADPRKAGLRGMAQAAAKGQIADAIGGAVNPIIGALKDRNAAQQQAIDQAKAIDAQQDQAGKEAAKVGKADDKAIADAMRAARNVVTDKPDMLQKQPLMDLIPEGASEAEQMRAAAEQGMVARMQTLIRISNQQVGRARAFQAGVNNLPAIMDNP